ncbi:MAG: FAD-dependent oxidoreductase, partial [Bdellovibrionales bacterium]|nr:FAD-dependent oxidoreductase [Bdellovibrionales bacterium]
MSLSLLVRKNNIEKMQREVFDLIIIGGGISGAGVARDAAMRGMKVALVEADDFASGTSSRSSKLIHGGIRYLENFEFGLVFEALRERQNLFEMAPHLVHPLRFMLPVYEGARVGMFKLGLGMWAYDALSSFEAPELHSRQDKAEALQHNPYLNPEKLAGSYIYSDAYMDDDRLVIETLRSAASHGACIANYVRASGAKFKEGQLSELVCQDALSKKEFSIKGRHFVSTVGPWTDLVANELLGEWRRIMRPSKGVHLTFSRKRLPIDEAV